MYMLNKTMFNKMVLAKFYSLLLKVLWHSIYLHTCMYMLKERNMQHLGVQVAHHYQLVNR